MSIDLSVEKAKWDAIYSSMIPAIDTPSQTTFNAELIRHVLAVLPEGGHSMEAGCGAGSHSLALAQTGLFTTTLLDISAQALTQAKQRFEAAQVDATFVVGSALEHGTPAFDLVFNNGTLEHYSFDEQVEFVNAMSSRSRRYVISLVPNATCYWYWIWRTLAAAKGDWPYGIEVPVQNQVDVFRAAKLHNVRVAYLGQDWTEDLIAALDGISPELRNSILTIHRSPLIPHSQKCYLVATVGEISEGAPAPSNLWFAPQISQYDTAKAMSALADALSIQIGAQLEISRLNTECSVLEAARNNADEATAKAMRSLRQVSSQLRNVSALMVQYSNSNHELKTSLAHVQHELAEERHRSSTLQLALDDSHSRLQHVLVSRRNTLLKLLYWIARKTHPESKTHRLLLNGRRALRKLRRDGFKPTLKLAIARALQRVQMNPYEYAFDIYLQSLKKNVPIEWQRVQVPFKPGLVTIVLPCFNGSDLLKESLDSMLAQTYEDIEIIAINDGSSDATAEILDDYSRRYNNITVIHQENRKLPRTLSRGFRQANGEFLTWTSVDNRMKPGCIAEMVASLRRHPDWDMVYANIDIIGESGAPLRGTDWYSGYQTPPGSEHIHLPSQTTELNTWPNNFIGAAFLYRARVAWAIQDYSPNRFLTEDYDYWMRVNELMELRHADFNTCIYDYRFHSNSLTSKDKELGITRNRVKLMVFDEFRRSFLLSKCVWSISTDGSASAQRTARDFEQELSQRMQIVIASSLLGTYSLSKLWMPIAVVHFGNSAESIPIDPNIMDSASLILVNTGDSLPEAISESWHFCISMARVDAGDLPRIEQGYRGWFSIPDISDLASFCDIQAKSRQISAIEVEAHNIALPASHGTALSVVICTYKRSAVLDRAIRSLLDQSLPRQEYELIIVNNEPSETHPRKIVQAILEERAPETRPSIRVLDCPIPGLSHARNVGLSESIGRYVIFIDDDAIAKPDCLAWMHAAFVENPEAGVIGGHVRLNLPDPRPEVCPPGREAIWSQYLTDHLEFAELAGWWQFPYGALWGARREVLLEIGGFRTNLGRIGNDFGGGEEIVAATLAQRLGYKIGVEPRAEVLHDVEPNRYTVEHVWKTVRSAELVNYRMQTSLYLPAEANLASTIKSLTSRKNLRGLLTATLKPRRPNIEQVYTAAYALAQLRLLIERAADFRRKFARPKSSSKY